MIVANDTDYDVQLGDTFGLEDRVYEVVEKFPSGDFRLKELRCHAFELVAMSPDITLKINEIAYCPRVVAL